MVCTLYVCFRVSGFGFRDLALRVYVLRFRV
jgi:hypothetical protein